MKKFKPNTRVVDSDYEIIKQGKDSSSLDAADERRPLGIVGRLLSGLKARVWTRDVQARRELVRESTGMIKDVHEYAVESAKLDLVPYEIEAMEIQMKAKVLEEQHNYNEVEHKLNQQPVVHERVDKITDLKGQIEIRRLENELNEIPSPKEGAKSNEQRRVLECGKIIVKYSRKLTREEIESLGVLIRGGIEPDALEDVIRGMIKNSPKGSEENVRDRAHDQAYTENEKEAGGAMGDMHHKRDFVARMEEDFRKYKRKVEREVERGEITEQEGAKKIKQYRAIIDEQLARMGLL